MTDVIESGPLFDGRADGMVEQMLTEVKSEIGDVALDRWRLNMIETFRHPSGVYESYAQKVTRDRDVVVNDGYGDTNDLQYGPWLEGVGSRNAPVTVFPGYRNLRRAAQYVWPRVSSYAQSIVDKWMVKLNGD